MRSGPAEDGPPSLLPSSLEVDSKEKRIADQVSSRDLLLANARLRERRRSSKPALSRYNNENIYYYSC